MATNIDWSAYTSDGVAGKFLGTPSNRLDEYLNKILLPHLNNNPAIIDAFGKSCYGSS